MKPDGRIFFETFYLELRVVALPCFFFFSQMIICVSLHTVQCLENVPLFFIYTRGVTCPAHILHSAFTDLWTGKEDLCVSEC